MIAEPITKPEMTPLVEQALGRLTETATGESVFGPPMERGEITLIPCSELSMALGAGGGNNPTKDQRKPAAGDGLGGGGGMKKRPLAIIVVKGDGVRVQPIVDVNKMVRAVFITLGIALVLLTRLRRGQRRGQRAVPPAPEKRTRRLAHKGA
jgi:uncharacterized spore protein YtfJ